MTLDQRSADRRFLVLTALRWLPVGLLAPIFVLIPLSRGLSLTEIGLVFAIQGLVVLALELPTGGLSDALGRRPVLLLASVVAILSMGLFTIADYGRDVRGGDGAAGHLPGARLRAARGVVRRCDAGRRPDRRDRARPRSWHGRAEPRDRPRCPGIRRARRAPSGARDRSVAAAAARGACRPGAPPRRRLRLDDRGATRASPGSRRRLDPRRAGDHRRGPAVCCGRRVSCSGSCWSSCSGASRWSRSRASSRSGCRSSSAARRRPPRSWDRSARRRGSLSAAGAAGVVVAEPTHRCRAIRGAPARRAGAHDRRDGRDRRSDRRGRSRTCVCYTVHGASNPMHTTLLHWQVDGSHRTTVLSINSMMSQPAGALGGDRAGRPGRRDERLDRDDRRRHHLRAGRAPLHPGVAQGTRRQACRRDGGSGGRRRVDSPVSEPTVQRRTAARRPGVPRRGRAIPRATARPSTTCCSASRRT